MLVRHPLVFPHVELDAFVIMPNHVHGILVIVDVRAGGQTLGRMWGQMWSGRKIFRPDGHRRPPPQPLPSSSSLQSPSRTIGSVVCGFKIGVTKWFLQNTDIYDVWQRNYYEHIIRGEASLHRILEYIISNPLRWVLDRENPTTTAPTEERDYFRNIMEG